MCVCWVRRIVQAALHTCNECYGYFYRNKLQSTKRKLISESLILFTLGCRLKCAHTKRINFNSDRLLVDWSVRMLCAGMYALCTLIAFTIPNWMPFSLSLSVSVCTSVHCTTVSIDGVCPKFCTGMFVIFRPYFHHFCTTTTEIRKLNQLPHAKYKLL